MKIKIDKSFEKDSDKIKDKTVLIKVSEIIESIERLSDYSQIKNLKKLKSSKNYFRIRVGDYRIGIKIIEDEIIFIRLLHRKDIYKFFP